jgi:DNA-binding CsgD family transcriptional regulator
VDRAVREVAAAADTATTVVDLCRALHDVVDRHVPSDRWCGFALDPSTLYPTNGFHDEGLRMELIPRMLEIEYGEDDVNVFTEVARSEAGVATLGQATGGDPSRSSRWREVIVPSGLAHEVRAVFRDGQGAWGALVLLRASDVDDFDHDEQALLSALGPAVAAAFRRALVRQHLAQADDVREAGILVLDGPTLTPQMVSAAARRWIDELDDGSLAGGLPTSIVGVARAATSGGAQPAAARTRTRSGRWLTITAERVEPVGGGARSVGLVLQPSRPAEIALIVSSAHGLSPREGDVVRLVAAGCTNQEIARHLGVSAHTVAEHLKRVFRKLGVATRGELTSRLFFDHYLPRSSAEDPAGVDGWFLPSGSAAREPA